MLTGFVFSINVLAIAWSRLFNSRLSGYFLFLILLPALLYCYEPVHTIIEKEMIGDRDTMGDCKNAKLFRVRDKCLFHRGVSEDNVEVCDLISVKSADFKNDCRDFIFRNRGSDGGDKKWCNYIVDSYQRKLCYE